MDTTAGSHIFISYKSEQRSFAFMVRDKIIEWGYEPWLDVDRLQPGTYWADDIDHALKTCRACLGIMTPQAISSRSVTNEWDLAVIRGVLFIPLMFEYTEPHYKYIDIQYIDFRERTTNQAFEQLRMRLDAQYPQSTAKQPSRDPYHGYLQQLYERINKYLSAKLVTSLHDEEGHPEPINVTTKQTTDTVDVLFEKHKDIDPLFVIGGIADYPQQEFDDFAKVFEYYEGRVLLLGEPGSGKTITLLNYARDAIIRRYNDISAPLPILGIIPSWDVSNSSISEWLASSFGVPRNTIQLIRDGQTLLLLDGLDELSQERPMDPLKPDGAKFDPRARFLDTIPSNNKILITCRVRDYWDIGEKARLFGAVTLTPLTDKQIQAFLADSPELWQALYADRKLREVARNPLLLSLFAFAYKKASPDELQTLVDLTKSSDDLRAKIFDAYIHERYEHELRKRNKLLSYDLSTIFGILGQLAILQKSLETNTGSPRGREAEFNTASNDATEILRSLLHDDPFTFIENTTRLHLIIQPQEHKPTFIHDTFRDYFALKYCIHQSGQPGHTWLKKRMIEILKRSDSSQSIPPLMMLLKDTNRDIRSRATLALGSKNDDRANEALIEAMSDINRDTRNYAAIAMGKYKLPNAISKLTALLLNDDYFRTRRSAAWALGEIGNKEAVSILKTSLEHEEHPKVRSAVIKALDQLNK